MTANAPWVGHAFGLRIESDFPFPGGAPGEPSEAPRRTKLRGEAGAGRDRDWPAASIERILTHHHPDGGVGLTVDRHEDGRHRVDAPGHGRFEISADGRLIGCALPDGLERAWQLPLLSHALPVAAELQGLDLLHASAVELDGRAVAFSAESGGGKTSLAIRLAGDRPLITDDVLAIELVEGAVRAHPGPRVANVPSADGGREQVALGEPPPGPLPLSGLYLIEPSAAADVRIEAVPAEPRRLLAALFLPASGDRERHERQLEVLERLAASVPLFRLAIPPGAVERAATAVDAHIRRVRFPA